MKRLALIAVVVFATLTVVVMLWQLRSIVLLFVLSLAIAAALRSPIDFLKQRGVPFVLATLVAYGVTVGGLAILGYFISSPLLDELDRLVLDLAAAYRRLQIMSQSHTGLMHMIAAQLPAADQLDELIASSTTFVVVQNVLGVTQSVFELASQLLLAVVLSIYWTADRVRFERLWLSLLPIEQRVHARNVWRAVETQVGAYIRSELLQSVLIGGLLTLGFLLLDMQYAFLMALLAALAWLVPLIGAGIAVAFVLLIGLWSGAYGAGLATLYTIGVLAMVELVVGRRLYRYDRYGSILVILVMIAMADVLGLLGLLVAPPIALAIQVFLNELLRTRAPVQTTPPPTVDLDLLRERLATVRALIENGESASSPRLINLSERLHLLIQEAEAATNGHVP